MYHLGFFGLERKKFPKMACQKVNGIFVIVGIFFLTKTFSVFTFFCIFSYFSIFLITTASDSTALVYAGIETRTVAEFSMSAACYQIAFHSYHPQRHCSF